MYPKICPNCHQAEQYVGRGFEHVSMYLRGQGRGTIYLRCAHCHNIFPWHYGEPDQANAVPGVAETVGKELEKRASRRNAVHS